MPSFYNEKNILVDLDFQGFKWIAPVECKIEVKEDHLIVFNPKTNKWEQIPDTQYINFAVENNIIKLDKYSKLVNGKIVDKTNEELLSDNTITLDEYNNLVNTPIIAKLNEIDFKSIRALRDGDSTWIQKYETQAEELRKKLK